MLVQISGEKDMKIDVSYVAYRFFRASIDNSDCTDQHRCSSLCPSHSKFWHPFLECMLECNMPSHYYPMSSRQLTVFLTEWWTANQSLTDYDLQRIIYGVSNKQEDDSSCNMLFFFLNSG